MTIANRRDIELTSTDGDKPDRLHQCRTCSTAGRNRNTKGRLSEATNHRVGSGYIVLMGQSLSYPRFHDRRQICSRIMGT
jgi:hypothetical protein